MLRPVHFLEILPDQPFIVRNSRSTQPLRSCRPKKISYLRQNMMLSTKIRKNSSDFAAIVKAARTVRSRNLKGAYGVVRSTDRTKWDIELRK